MSKKYISKHIVHFVTCVFLFIYCSLPSSVFAQLAIDAHIPTQLHDGGNTPIMASVSIDSLKYDPSGAGVAYLDGTFYLHNYHKREKCTFAGELRLEIFEVVDEPNEDGVNDLVRGNPLAPDARVPVSGSLEKWEEDAPLSDIETRISKSVNIYLDCQTPEPVEDKEYTMSAAITLRVEIRHTNETWEINEPTYTKNFRYWTETDEEEIHGLGPTTDGEIFSDDCEVNWSKEREWQSLMLTDILYDVIYWYVKGPGDTSLYGDLVETDWGDGVSKSASMTYEFPAEVDDPNAPGDQQWVYYEIGALVYRSDHEIDEHSYKVMVFDTR